MGQGTEGQGSTSCACAPEGPGCHLPPACSQGGRARCQPPGSCAARPRAGPKAPGCWTRGGTRGGTVRGGASEPAAAPHLLRPLLPQASDSQCSAPANCQRVTVRPDHGSGERRKRGQDQGEGGVEERAQVSQPKVDRPLHAPLHARVLEQRLFQLCPRVGSGANSCIQNPCPTISEPVFRTLESCCKDQEAHTKTRTLMFKQYQSCSQNKR